MVSRVNLKGCVSNVLYSKTNLSLLPYSKTAWIISIYCGLLLNYNVMYVSGFSILRQVFPIKKRMNIPMFMLRAKHGNCEKM